MLTFVKKKHLGDGAPWMLHAVRRGAIMQLQTDVRSMRRTEGKTMINDEVKALIDDIIYLIHKLNIDQLKRVLRYIRKIW